jgi:hypothetical protein
MREMLKIMGVSDSALMGSWYVLQSFIFFTMAVLITVFSKIG